MDVRNIYPHSVFCRWRGGGNRYLASILFIFIFVNNTCESAVVSRKSLFSVFIPCHSVQPVIQAIVCKADYSVVFRVAGNGTGFIFSRV
jgi:hypothetical protein